MGAVGVTVLDEMAPSVADAARWTDRGDGYPEGMRAAISDDELGDLLTDPACPSAILHGSKGDAAIEVEAAVAFVHLRHPTALNIEGQIDRFVNSVGGRKDEVLRLTDLGRDFVSRLLGRQRPSGAALYVIPGRVFAERGRRPKNVSLPQSSM